MTLKGPCVQGLVKWKVGQPAIDRLEQRGQGHVSFKWRKIGKLIPEKDLVNHVTSPAPLYEDMPNSLYTNQEEWWYWLYQVSSSKSGVTPALLKRMPQERSQEYDELLVELTMNVMLQYPEMTPAGALKKAWKIVRGKTRAQLTRDPIVFWSSCSFTFNLFNKHLNKTTDMILLDIIICWECLWLLKKHLNLPLWVSGTF